MPATWGRTVDVVKLQVGPTNSEDIQAMLMVTIHESFFVIFGWRNSDVSSVQAPRNRWKSCHGSKLSW